MCTADQLAALSRKLERLSVGDIENFLSESRKVDPTLALFYQTTVCLDDRARCHLLRICGQFAEQQLDVLEQSPSRFCVAPQRNRKNLFAYINLVIAFLRDGALYSPDDAAVLKAFKKEWPVIRRILVFLQAVIQSDKRLSQRERQAVLEARGNILGNLFADARFRGFIPDEQEAFRILLEAWYTEEPYVLNGKGVGHGLLGLSMLALSGKLPSWKDTIMHESRRFVLRTAELSSQYFLERTPDLEQVGVYQNILLLLITIPSAYSVLHELPLAALLTKSLAVQTSTLSGQVAERELIQITSCLLSLQTELSKGHAGSYKSALAAVKARLLDALGKAISHPRVSRDAMMMGCMSELLGTSLPGFFVLHSFLRRLLPALENMDISPFRTIARTGPFREAWQTFTVGLLEWMIYHRICELVKSKSEAPDECCSNCYKPYKRSTLKECAGCCKSMYCSKECQRSAWTAHKPACSPKPVAPARYNPARSLPPYIPNFDLNSMALLTNMVFERHVPGIRALAKERFPSKKMTELGVVIYTHQYPPVFELFEHKIIPRLEDVRMTSAAMLDAPMFHITNRYFAREDPVLPRRGECEMGIVIGCPDDYFDKAADKIESRLHGIKRPVGVTSSGKPLPVKWDIVDDVFDVLGYREATDWLSGPFANRGDRLRRFYSKVDPVIENDLEMFARRAGRQYSGPT